jgi:hypothetical protein
VFSREGADIVVSRKWSFFCTSSRKH